MKSVNSLAADLADVPPFLKSSKIFDAELA